MFAEWSDKENYSVEVRTLILWRASLHFADSRLENSNFLFLSEKEYQLRLSWLHAGFSVQGRFDACVSHFCWGSVRKSSGSGCSVSVKFDVTKLAMRVMGFHALHHQEICTKKKAFNPDEFHLQLKKTKFLYRYLPAGAKKNCKCNFLSCFFYVSMW